MRGARTALVCPTDGARLRKRVGGWTCHVCRYVAPQRDVELHAADADRAQLALIHGYGESAGDPSWRDA